MRISLTLDVDLGIGRFFEPDAKVEEEEKEEKEEPKAPVETTPAQIELSGNRPTFNAELDKRNRIGF